MFPRSQTKPPTGHCCGCSRPGRASGRCCRRCRCARPGRRWRRRRHHRCCRCFGCRSDPGRRRSDSASATAGGPAASAGPRPGGGRRLLPPTMPTTTTTGCPPQPKPKPNPTLARAGRTGPFTLLFRFQADHPFLYYSDIGLNRSVGRSVGGGLCRSVSSRRTCTALAVLIRFYDSIRFVCACTSHVPKAGPSQEARNTEPPDAEVAETIALRCTNCRYRARPLYGLPNPILAARCNDGSAQVVSQAQQAALIAQNLLFSHRCTNEEGVRGTKEPSVSQTGCDNRCRCVGRAVQTNGLRMEIWARPQRANRRASNSKEIRGEERGDDEDQMLSETFPDAYGIGRRRWQLVAIGGR